MIKFNLTVCLKPYIDKKTTDLRKKAEKDFEKDFFNLMNNAFGKIMENVRKLVARRNYLDQIVIYKFFSQKMY